MNYALWEPVFDPSDVTQLFIQDAVGEGWGSWPSLSQHDVTSKGDADLAQFIEDIRCAVLLPLNPGFVDGMEAILELAEGEAVRRINARQKAEKQRREYGPSDWASADLVAEVEALCGMGKQSGKEVWFSCWWHDDSTPSLHVDPSTRRWHCFGCQRGGGVTDWRKAVRESAR